MTATTSHYETFQTRRKQLLNLLERAAPAFSGLLMKAWAETAGQLQARVDSDRFRVMILGEFKRGKSTFINALLQSEVLPADIAPCTAVINEVKWGDSPRAFLHFRQPLPASHGPIPTEARRHIDRHRGGPVPPLDIPVTDLPEFVRIPDPSADQAASVAESPYDRVEVYWPLDLCRNGVEIIDSPGLNEHHTRTKTTRDYLAHIDAVVFVMSVHALASESELALIDNDLRPSGHEFLFFVCNRFDEIRRKEDRDKIINYAYTKLSDRTRFGREGVFFLSAVDALEGRLNGDAGLVKRSGIGPLERSLERFLVEDRGRVKLLQPCSNLARGLRTALAEVIPTQRRLLDEDMANLRQRLDQVRPQLDQATRKREQVLRQVDAARMRVQDAVRREAERFFSELSHDVPLWVRKMETRPLRPIFWPSKGQVDELSQEVVARLQPAIEESLEQWRRTTLRRLLDQQMAELTESLDASLEPFLDYLQGVKARLSGGLTAAAASTSLGTGSLERVLTSGAGGALLGAGLVVASATGIGHVVAASGVAAVVTGVATQVGATLLSVALNPLFLVPAVVGVVALHRHRGAALTEQVKMQTATAVAEQLRTQAGAHAAALAEEVYNQTAPLAQAIADGLDLELTTVREQVEAVVRHKEQGEAEIQRQRQALGRHEEVVRSLDGELNELVFALGNR